MLIVKYQNQTNCEQWIRSKLWLINWIYTQNRYRSMKIIKLITILKFSTVDILNKKQNQKNLKLIAKTKIKIEIVPFWFPALYKLTVLYA